MDNRSRCSPVVDDGSRHRDRTEQGRTKGRYKRDLGYTPKIVKIGLTTDAEYVLRECHYAVVNVQQCCLLHCCLLFNKYDACVGDAVCTDVIFCKFADLYRSSYVC